ncbi:MAG TPA: hypothetical protein VIM58_07990 [Candidatus Methylacidiphilales bacterium]
MNRLRSLSLCIGLFALVLPVSPLRAADPSVDEIVAKALAKADADESNLARYEYLQHVLFEKLDGNDKVVKSSKLEMKVGAGPDHPFTILQKGGVTEEQEKQARLSQKFKLTFSLRKVAPRYDIRLDGKETQNGRTVYRLAFRPKADPQPYQNRVEKISNHFGGLIWIDGNDYTLLKVRASLDGPVDMAWILATMESLDFTYESCPVAGGSTPCRFLIAYRLGFVVGEIRQRDEITTTDYSVALAKP